MCMYEIYTIYLKSTQCVCICNLHNMHAICTMCISVYMKSTQYIWNLHNTCVTYTMGEYTQCVCMKYTQYIWNLHNVCVQSTQCVYVQSTQYVCMKSTQCVFLKSTQCVCIVHRYHTYNHPPPTYYQLLPTCNDLCKALPLHFNIYFTHLVAMSIVSMFQLCLFYTHTHTHTLWCPASDSSTNLYSVNANTHYHHHHHTSLPAWV